MAVRYDAAGDAIRLSTSIPDYNSAYTIGGWIYPITDPNLQQIPLAVAQGTNGLVIDRIRSLSSGDNWVIQASNTTAVSTTCSLITYGAWAHIAMVRTNITTLQFYLNGVLDGTATFDVTGRAAATAITIGGSSSTTPGDPMSCRTYAWKYWTAALSAAEIATESRGVLPSRLTSLAAWWPMRPGTGERTRDYSGNGRSFTEMGTLTDEDPAPIGWGAPVRAIPFIAAAAAAADPPEIIHALYR